MKKVTLFIFSAVVVFSALFLPTCNDGELIANSLRTESMRPITLYGTLSIHGNEPFTYTIITDNQGHRSVLTGEPVAKMNQTDKGSTFVVTGLIMEPDPLYADLPIIIVEDYITLD